MLADVTIFDLISSFLPPWLLPAVTAVCSLLIAQWRLPGLYNWFRAKWKSIKSDPSVPSVDSGNVTSLLDQMVAGLPAIKDPEFHKQSVDACVEFAEAIIREAGIIEDAPKDQIKPEVVEGDK